MKSFKSTSHFAHTRLLHRGSPVSKLWGSQGPRIVSPMPNAVPLLLLLKRAAMLADKPWHFWLKVKTSLVFKASPVFG